MKKDTKQRELTTCEQRCPTCDLPLYERKKKLYFQGALIIDHQWYCKKCKWWTDGVWEVS